MESLLDRVEGPAIKQGPLGAVFLDRDRATAKAAGDTQNAG